jgi:hypothetical protein
MTLADSVTSITTLYNVPNFQPRLLFGDAYTPTTSIYINHGAGNVNSLIPTSYSGIDYAIAVTSLDVGNWFGGYTQTSSFPRYATFWLQDQNQPQDTDYILQDVMSRGVTRYVEDEYPEDSKYLGEVSGKDSLVKVERTYRFMSRFWYGYGYQRSARIQLYGTLVSKSDYISRISPHLYLWLGVNSPNGPLFYKPYDYVATSSLNYIWPTRVRDSSLPVPFQPRQYADGGNAALGLPVSWWDRFEDIECNTPQTFSNTQQPSCYYAGYQDWVMSSFGSNPPTYAGSQNFSLAFAQNIPSSTAIPYTGVHSILVNYAPLPDQSTSKIIPALSPSNAPFDCSSRYSGWDSFFTYAANSQLQSYGCTVIYSCLENIFDFSLNLKGPFWVANTNAWFRGKCEDGSAVSEGGNLYDETIAGSFSGVVPYPFPGLNLRGLFPRTATSRFVSLPASAAPLNRSKVFYASEVVNVIVLSDLSAGNPNTALSSQYQHPGVNQNDAGGVNDLLDVRELVFASRALKPAFREFKTLVFYDIDPPQEHERLEMPLTSIISGTSSEDGFFQHTANWSLSQLNYLEVSGELIAFFSGNNQPGSNVRTCSLVELCEVRTFTCTNVHDTRKAMAISQLQTTILSFDPSGQYVVWCGTISSSDSKDSFVSRILAAS